MIIRFTNITHVHGLATYAITLVFVTTIKNSTPKMFDDNDNYVTNTSKAVFMDSNRGILKGEVSLYQ
jgi:hypothetical protein